MRYEVRCQQCAIINIMDHYYPLGAIIDFPCPVCGGRQKRVASSFGFHRGWQAHFNPSVGTYVRNPREFSDELKRKSDEASVRTGMTHNFVPVDMNDPKSVGVTEDGMEQIERDNASRKRGTAPVHVGEPPGDSTTVGGRARWATEESPVPQEEG